jgi:hypothetical protein
MEIGPKSIEVVLTEKKKAATKGEGKRYIQPYEAGPGHESFVLFAEHLINFDLDSSDPPSSR